MTKIGLAQQSDALASYELGFAKGVMYALVTEQAWIEEAPFYLNGKTHKVGETFEKLGTRPRRTLEMQEGHWLEYAGRIGKLLLFMSDGECDDGWFYAFYQIGDRLVIANEAGNCSDIW